MGTARHRQVRVRAVVVAATVACVGVTAATAPAGASTATPAAGTARSTLELLTVGVAGQTVTAVQAALDSKTTSGKTATITLTPLVSSVTGPVGAISVTPANSPQGIGITTGALPGGVGSITGPAAQAAAALTSTGAVATVLGDGSIGLDLLGAPLQLSGAEISDVASVSPTEAVASKEILVSALELPTIAELLEGLGLDIGKLTQDQLTQLVGVVQETLSSVITTLNTQIDGLQSTLSTTVDTGAGATALLATAEGDLDVANDALTAAESAFDAAFGALDLTVINTALTAASLPTISGTLDYALWGTLSAAQQALIDGLTGDDLAALAATVATAQAAVTAAQAVIDQVQQLLDLLTELVTQVTNALSGDPLAVLGGITLGTEAVASASPSWAGVAEIGALDVLGVEQTVDGTLASVTAALDPVMTALGDALGSITGVTFTPLALSVGTPAGATGTSGAFRTATASLTGLTLTLPKLTVPTALAIAGAGSVPYLTGTASGYSTPDVSLTLGAITESATWRPAVAATGTTTPPQVSPPADDDEALPLTGGTPLLPAAALLLVVAAAAVRRWRAVPVEG